MERVINRKRIAVILSNMEGEYVSDTLRGIEKEAYAQGMDVCAFNASTSTDEKIKHNIGEYKIYDLVNYSLFDGVVLFANLIQGYSVFNSVIEKIKASGVPAISIDGELEGIPSVGGADYQPMKDMVTHLIEEHHYTRINYISGQDFNSDSRERLVAYCDALKEHGIPVEESRIFKGAFTNTHGRETAKKMLETPENMPEAIVCATDSIAVGVMTVFRRFGIKVPQQVAVVGFDNIFEARNSSPKLTTIARNPEAMGREAIRSIVKLLRGEEIPVRQYFPAQPIYRESCGCHDKEADDIVTLRRKYVETQEHYENYLMENNMLMEDLSAAKNFDDYIERLKKYIETAKCETFSFCLDKKLVDYLRNGDNKKQSKVSYDEKTEELPETMTAALVYEKGIFVEGGDFPIAQAVPKLPDEAEAAHTCLFLPVHFREHFMGYVILKDSRGLFFSPLFGARLINLSNSLESLRKQVNLQSMVEELDKRYVRDPLTGLYNRFGFNRYTTESFIKCVSHDDSFMVLIADLDGLKEINDKYGHDAGDVAISAAAYILQNVCQGEEVCARIGGDEFVVYAEGYTEGDAIAFCKRLEKLIGATNAELRKPYQISISVGYEVAYPEAGETLEQYMDLADNQMYINKKKKKEILADNVRIVK